MDLILPAPLILGSQSPRRKQLLQDTGFEFEVKVRPVEEEVKDDLTPEEVVKQIARTKAEAFQDLTDNHIIITADTIVVVDDQILGKPANRQEAFEMIALMNGRSHEVISAASIYYRDIQHVFAETTKVFFRDLSPFEIYHYIDQYSPFDKAGAYGIQEWIGMVGIEKIEGDFYNVMGLPIGALYRNLKRLFGKSNNP